MTVHCSPMHLSSMIEYDGGVSVIFCCFFCDDDDDDDDDDDYDDDLGSFVKSHDVCAFLE